MSSIDLQNVLSDILRDIQNATTYMNNFIDNKCLLINSNTEFYLKKAGLLNGVNYRVIDNPELKDLQCLLIDEKVINSQSIYTDMADTFNYAPTRKKFTPQDHRKRRKNNGY